MDETLNIEKPLSQTAGTVAALLMIPMHARLVSLVGVAGVLLA